MRILGTAFVGMAFVFACGGGGESGPDLSVELGELTADEITEFCADAPVREVVCDGGTFSSGPEDCEELLNDIPDTCTATLADEQACDDAIDALSDDEICTATDLPPECDPVLVEECLIPG